MLGIAEYVWRLIPANPILLRVVQMNGKRRRDLFIRCGYLGLLIGVVIFPLVFGNASAGNLSELAKSSAKLFQTLSYCQLGLVALLAPIFTAGAITQEKDSQTYDILLATPLSNGQIVLGSLLSRLFFVIALLVSGIPIFSITQIFGGVAISSIVESFFIATATALVTGAVAMAIAVLKVGTRRTIFSFYLFIVMYMVGLFVLERIDYFHILYNNTTVNSATHPKDPKDTYASATSSETVRRGNIDVIRTNQVTYTFAGENVTSVSTSSEIWRAKTSWLTGLQPFLALRTVFHDSAYMPPDRDDLPDQYKGWLLGNYLSDPARFYVTFMFFISFVLITPSILLLRHLAQSTTSIKTHILQKLHITRGDRTRKPRVVWHNPIAWREAKTKASAARASVLRYGFIILGVGGALTMVVMFATLEKPKFSAYIDGSSFNPTGQLLSVSYADGSVVTLPVDNSPTITYTDEQAAGEKVDHAVQPNIESLLIHMTQGRLSINAGAKTNADGIKTSWTSLDAYSTPRRLSAPDVRKALLGAAVIEFAVILLIVTNAAASTVTREKEDGTLDLLLSSPITSRYYIWGKLRGLVSFALPLVAVPVVSAAIFVVYDSMRKFGNWNDPGFQWIVFPEAVVILPGMLVIVVAFASILGMQMSLRLRKTVVAVMSSIGIVVGICALMGWCGYSTLQTGGGFAPFWLGAGAFSPFTLLTVLIDPYSNAGNLYNDTDAGTSRLEVFVVTWIAIGVYTTIVYFMYKSMVKNFDMTIRKQSR